MVVPSSTTASEIPLEVVRERETPREKHTTRAGNNCRKEGAKSACGRDSVHANVNRARKEDNALEINAQEGHRSSNIRQRIGREKSEKAGRWKLEAVECRNTTITPKMQMKCRRRVARTQGRIEISEDAQKESKQQGVRLPGSVSGLRGGKTRMRSGPSSTSLYIDELALIYRLDSSLGPLELRRNMRTESRVRRDRRKVEEAQRCSMICAGGGTDRARGREKQEKKSGKERGYTRKAGGRNRRVDVNRVQRKRKVCTRAALRQRVTGAPRSSHGRGPGKTTAFYGGQAHATISVKARLLRVVLEILKFTLLGAGFDYAQGQFEILHLNREGKEASKSGKIVGIFGYLTGFWEDLLYIRMYLIGSRGDCNVQSLYYGKKEYKKGAKKGRKREPQTRFCTWKVDFFPFQPCLPKLKRGKNRDKNGGNTKKGRKQGTKKGRKKGTVNDPISSAVIRKLFDDRGFFEEMGKSSGIAFFYFDFKSKGGHAVGIALQQIFLQLSAQALNGYGALDKHYRFSGEEQMLPTYQDLVEVFKELLLELEHTYIILDALDECPDIELNELVQLVSMLGSWTEGPLHLLITSQPRSIFRQTQQT
ncbi:hypothetical protein C8R44DRAFT_733235 [Mycena epipterygia]|nr:hypothetical protein C8R44DRAFT_733235 [Mycena epipterygia]